MSHTVKHCEDSERKNEEIFTKFVLDRKEMLIYFENDVYVTESTAGRNFELQPEAGSVSPNYSPLSNGKRLYRRVASIIEVSLAMLCE